MKAVEKRGIVRVKIDVSQYLRVPKTGHITLMCKCYTLKMITPEQTRPRTEILLAFVQDIIAHISMDIDKYDIVTATVMDANCISQLSHQN